MTAFKLTRPIGLSMTGGVSVGGDVVASDPYPDWMTAAIGQWAQIPDTTAPYELASYSGLSWRDDETGVTAYSAANGGHSAGARSNRVMAINFAVASPAWLELLAASDITGTSLTNPVDPEFVSDGHPIARHLYNGIDWVPELSRVMIGGEAGGDDATGSFPDHYGFNPATNDWDAAGTWPDRPNYRCNAAALDPVSGKRWGFWPDGTGNRMYEWNPAADPPTWTTRTMTGGTDYAAKRGAYCYDTTRDKITHLAGGGWFTQAAGWSAQQIDPTTYARTDISFNTSAGFTDFTTNSGKFIYSALVYAPEDDCFYFYNGNTGSPVLTGQGAKVYKITPNGTATWDMEILSVTGVTPAGESNASGAHTKFFYVPRWRCLFLLVGGQSVYYLRVGTV